MKTNAFIIICLGLINTAYSQSLLWEISGKGLKSPSYLYGTIHIQDNRVFLYGDEVKRAFEQAEAYAMEVIIDKIDKDKMKNLIYMKKKSLNDFYTSEEYDLVDKYCQEKMGVGLNFVGKMKPFFLSSQLMQLEMPKDQDLALDAYFLMEARKADKKIIGIEKLKDQIGAISKISIEEQADMLLEMVKAPKKNSEKFEKLVQSYISFDFEQMQELLSDTTLPKQFEKALLIKRNKKMARRIAKIVKKQVTFNAIGAGHLLGEKGVVELLRKKGFTMKAIPFKFEKVESE